MSQIIKLVLMGDGGVGKTTFLTKLITGKFDPRYFATLGYSYSEFAWQNICFQIWDMAGQPNFRGEFPPGEKFDMALVFVDPGSKITCIHCPHWIAEIDSIAKVIGVVGNKSDLGNIIVDANVFEVLKDNYLEFSCKTDSVDKLMSFVKEKCSGEGSVSSALTSGLYQIGQIGPRPFSFFI
jgi:GTP-binding nuclear protein Ran